MRSPLIRMRLRSLYDSKPQTFHPSRSVFGQVRSGGHRAHQGWDLSAPPGTPVWAITYGKCVHVQLTDHANPYDGGGSYGRHVVLEFVQPILKITYYAFYAHLQSVVVSAGMIVEEGACLGFTGRSGKEARKLPIDQAHLHFEIRTIPATGKGLGHHLDPAEFLPRPLPEIENLVSPRHPY
jgi:murein DD-endopeptidase MepM/ murein hydrolase activator NlpD